jgi:hypothetical protein
MDALTNAVTAYLEPEASQIQCFLAIREVLPAAHLEELCGVLEPVLADLEGHTVETLTREAAILVHAAIVVCDLASLLTSVAVDPGLADGDRYLAARNRLAEGPDRGRGSPARGADGGTLTRPEPEVGFSTTARFAAAAAPPRAGRTGLAKGLPPAPIVAETPTGFGGSRTCWQAHL